MSPPIHTSVKRYEAWLGDQLGPLLVHKDLHAKHDLMAGDRFAFLRGSCWRWAEIAPEVCPELMDAPSLLAVGDAHVGNFGLWRDVEGRLVWGVDDFDEAASTPYALDLVRLAASAVLFGAGAGRSAVAKAILSGYAQGLNAPKPFVLEVEDLWLRDLAAASDKERIKFWRKLIKAGRAQAPLAFVAALESALPAAGTPVRISHRQAGVGSLGRPRFVAVGQWAGGPFAREVKALVPSCWAMAGRPGQGFSLAASAARSPDPWLKLDGPMVVRRLAPNSRKLPTGALRIEPRLLAAMGHELGSLHAADPGRPALVLADLRDRRKTWLADAATRVVEATMRDWRAFRA